MTFRRTKLGRALNERIRGEYANHYSIKPGMNLNRILAFVSISNQTLKGYWHRGWIEFQRDWKLSRAGFLALWPERTPQEDDNNGGL